MMAHQVGYQLEGLPKGTSKAEISEFSKDLPPVHLVKLFKYTESAEVLLRVDESDLKALEQALREHPFRGLFLSGHKCPLPVKKANRNNRKAKKGKTKSNAAEFAESFHEFIVSQPELREQATDREAAGKVFRDFYQSSKKATPSRMMESLVMSALRQKRLMRTKRLSNNNTVIVTFANRDGNFPTLRERKTAREQVIEKQQELEANKHGVSLSTNPKSQQSFLPIGKTQTTDFVIELEDTEEAGEEQSLRKTQLEEILLEGPHVILYKLSSVPNKNSILSSLTATKFSVSLTPQRIGVFRVTVNCRFRRIDPTGKEMLFSIVRPLAVRSGFDAEMDQILAPTTPYKKAKRKNRSRRKIPSPEDTFDAPPAPALEKRKSGDQNPFKDLSHYRIPGDLNTMLDNDEFKNVLTPWAATDEKGYAEFWEKMLWASEHQNYKDIEMYDMEDAKLKHFGGNTLSLAVPGLAEGRPSVLRGDIVNVTWNGKLYKGRVQETRLLEVILKFHRDFHKKYKPGLDVVELVRFTFSRMSYRTSHKGCQMAESRMGAAMLAPSQDHVDKAQSSIAESSARALPSVGLKFANRGLNPEQQMAVSNIFQAKLRGFPYIIFGPPGTGKTTTIVEAVYQLVAQAKMKVLLVAPSNDAADILAERLAAHFPPSELCRPIAYSRTTEGVPLQIRDYVSSGSNREKQTKDILAARIVISTVNLAARFPYFAVPPGHFDVLCVDEAGHATEPEVVSTIAGLVNLDHGKNKVGQVVLAGDPRQLGPIITSRLCVELGMSVSYLERLMNREVYGRQDGHYQAHLLTKLVRNYRSHPSIIKLPNEMFYDNELQCCGDTMVIQNMAKWEHLPSKGFPLLFHSIDGENLREANSPSWFNPQEVQQVVIYVKLLLEATRPPVRTDEIGIITPYARQAQKIRLALKTQGVSDIKVGSVEAFQGQERRCIIVSTVRSQTEHGSSDIRYNLGFVANEKRFNVAVTRAKTLLIVIGCAKVLEMDKKGWLPFLKWCYENKSFVGEEWNPAEVEDKDLPNDAIDEEEWDVVQGTEQESFLLVHREE